MKINIQESLKERDSITENRYNLYNTYTANNYTAEQKKKIAEAIYKGATDTELLEMLDDSEVEYREVQEYAKANSNRRFRDEDGNIFSIWDLLNDFIDWELDDKVEEEPNKSVKQLFIDYIRNSTDKNGTLEEIKENLEFEESISSNEPVVKFQGKSFSTFTKDKKWEVDFDEAGNILARTRHGKPFYFKGHINDEINDFPSTDEDNIILAAREQYELKFGNKAKRNKLTEESAFTEVSYGGAFDVVYTGKNKVNEGIDGWDNRTGVIKRIDKYLYDNPEAIPPKGYIQPGSRAYDDAVSRYGDYVTTPFGNISTDDLMQYARDNKLLNEAHYGGAFDIRDDQYFTKEDLMEFAEEVMYVLHTNAKGPLATPDYTDLYVDGNQIFITVIDEDGNEFTDKISVDFRRIRRLSDLISKYTLPLAERIMAQAEDFYRDINEGCSKKKKKLIKESDNSLNHEMAVKMSRDDLDDIQTYFYDDESWEDAGVSARKDFEAEGREFTWVKRHGDVEHLDFDNWAVWEAYCHDDVETYYFIVDEDTGFIDLGPVDTLEEAQEFLASKVSDWEDLD